MKTQTENFRKVTFKKDFSETLDLFDEMIKKDKRIIGSMEKRYKKNGIFSHSIRFLISDYVLKYKDKFKEVYNVQAENNSEEKESP